jgi:hypothetical protein
MSSLAYGLVTAQREAAPKDTSKEPEAGQPGFGSYIDVVAALVPAEVLAANAALLPLMTETTTDEAGNSVTAITEPETLKVVFVLSIVFSLGLYVIGLLQRLDRSAVKPRDWLGMVIPPLAFVGWTMLQKSTAFDAVAPEMDEPLRFTIAVFGAVALGALAAVLSFKANKSEPTT